MARYRAIDTSPAVRIENATVDRKKSLKTKWHRPNLRHFVVENRAGKGFFYSVNMEVRGVRLTEGAGVTTWYTPHWIS